MRARTSAIAAEPPLTEGSAAPTSGACPAIAPEPKAGSESDGCRAGKLFFGEGHRLAVARARLSARSGVQPTPPRVQRPANTQTRSRPDPIARVLSPRRVECPTRARQSLPQKRDARGTRRATRRGTQKRERVPPLPLRRAETRVRCVANPERTPAVTVPCWPARRPRSNQCGSARNVDCVVR